jgi:quinoprotein glucose dehydrogenase
VGEDTLIDFTPKLRQEALELVKDYKLGPIYTPPVVSKEPGPIGTLALGPANGGTNWPGGSFNPETHTVFVYACNACLSAYGLVKPPPGMSDLDYVEGHAGERVVMINAAGADQGADAPLQRAALPAPAPQPATARRSLTVEGLPLVKPPYATISAIDLDSGNILWQVAHGETPDYIRGSPALKGIDLPRTGQASFNIGTLVTRDLVVAGDSAVTTTPDRPRGAMLRAYDQKTGKEVGTVLMPAAQSGSPMTYMVGGKQYIMVAVSGGNYSGEYICYTLPR